ncbi:N-acyl-D-amino-acid deacylase family protein [Yinghuangia seranimata]|uniref:N-acyl-D-amino-acid deacylase family protein n=1 Tax=Yinghuangia seranimata TaxID=408067 RepID=UPI00248BAF07|nr:amidohydrolase family protein [Yinghuangia seranimata]MDI2128039.1 amidohydrolase family protein [Yinghuangia seranimata]
MVGGDVRTVLRGGLVADGTGGALYRADVALSAGRVTELGPDVEAMPGDRVLDASGCVVAPGFIDVHTHYDAQVFWDPACTPSSYHGVTTAVLGNCGFSLAPCRPDRRALMVRMLHDLEDMRTDTLEAGIGWGFATFGEYLDAVERLGPVINLAAYVGHSAVRIDVMGEEAYEREATDLEVAEMRMAVRDALAAGAIGFATSASPTGRRCPSRFAGAAETTGLLDELRDAGRGVASFVPGGAFDHAALYELQPRIGRPFTWTALLALADGRHREWADLHRAGTAAGADVHPQVTCRPLVAQTTLLAPFALRAASLAELEGSSMLLRAAAYRDRGWRDRLAAELAEGLLAPRWDRWFVAESGDEALVGRTVAEVAEERDTAPLDCALDIALADDLATRFTVVLANDDEAEVADLLTLDGAVLGLSDAGAHPDQICDAVLPTDLLGGWVRDRGVLALPAAVRKLTGEPADLFGLADRGYLRVGAAADVVVFDPAAIGPGPIRRVTDFPADADRLVADAPTGVRHVLVAGVPIRCEERQVDRPIDFWGHAPGRVLRSTADGER